MKTKIHLLLLFTIVFSLISGACQPQETKTLKFDQEMAYQYAQTQLSFGYRYPGSDGHSQTVDWLTTELKNNQWEVTLYEYPYNDQVITNIVAHRAGSAPHILLGAHYDTRFFADQDANSPSEPLMGANDGASGVAVLLELSRVIPAESPNEISLAFFDFEDQGGIEQYNWIAGSTALAGDPSFTLPDKVVVIDMIGDKDLNIYMDRNSDEALTAEIWQAAQELHYNQYFIPESKYSMLDDHVPFKNQGIPSIDMIDFDYPAWHTTKDTLENISAKSLGIVGETLLYWLSKSIVSEDDIEL
jgi:glutaminyl-peptide cyclotransferase